VLLFEFFPFGCLPDDDELLVSLFTLFHLLGPEAKAKAKHERGGAVLCSFQRRAAEAVSLFLVGLWHEIGRRFFFDERFFFLAFVEWNVCVI
jgi:hypothetical protein